MEAENPLVTGESRRPLRPGPSAPTRPRSRWTPRRARTLGARRPRAPTVALGRSRPRSIARVVGHPPATNLTPGGPGVSRDASAPDPWWRRFYLHPPAPSRVTAPGLRGALTQSPSHPCSRPTPLAPSTGPEPLSFPNSRFVLFWFKGKGTKGPDHGHHPLLRPTPLPKDRGWRPGPEGREVYVRRGVLTPRSVCEEWRETRPAGSSEKPSGPHRPPRPRGSLIRSDSDPRLRDPYRGRFAVVSGEGTRPSTTPPCSSGDLKERGVGL